DKTFAEVAAAREAVTNLYVNNGYATSGAIVPPQSVTDGIVDIQIVEGSLDEIIVEGTRRLRSGYISSRLGLSAAAPLNVDRLVERLQLLQSDPLIDSISADLQASPEPGKNTLVVSVVEADSFGVTYTLDNNRSPSVGTLRNQLQVSEGNLLGFGDRLAVDYTLTSGSDGVGFDYRVPVSPYDTTLGMKVNLSDSEVIEDPFDVLEIESESDAYEVTLRHPLRRTPTQELAIGLTASHQRTQTELGIDDIGPFPLAPGADDEGQTRVSALRFFQEWTHRSPKQVLALRSQFNVGIDVLDATVNDDAPDSQFFSWQGQAQWLNVLAPDTLLLLKGSAQLATDALLSLEQLSLGGQSTVRGYRQNFLSTDNGVSAAAEVRLPIARERSSDLLLQAAPFLDAGYGWNHEGDDPDPIVGIGLGLIFQWQALSARLDWGIPLTDAGSDRNSLQESGVYFNLRYSFF
ncbi:MAG: ShlB/FhaC/HecB family hemolysin secretion/activation protein, partial [Leptolyngbya sp. SIO4C1]|nr:ShlB/FhaC/HecB family hemolysin secretion/activation protein [Leptolyngbya sp. SIO4C1]